MVDVTDVKKLTVQTWRSWAEVLRGVSEKYLARDAEKTSEELALLEVQEDQDVYRMDSREFGYCLNLAINYGELTEEAVATRCKTSKEQVQAWRCLGEHVPRFVRPFILKWLSEIMRENADKLEQER